MLHYFLLPYADQFSILNVLQYITFRSGAALMTALFFCLIAGPHIIAWLKSLQGSGQPIRDCGPESHLLTKQGTPTMGGFMILLGLLLGTLLWADLTNPYVWIVLLVTGGFGLLGFADDYLKLTKRNHHGLPGKAKLLGQAIISAAAAYFIMQQSPEGIATHLSFPFVKDWVINLSLLYIPFIMLVMVGASNAVNLTDGLDGLAIVPVMIATACFAIIAYVCSHAVFSDYLQLNRVPGTDEIAIICASMIGAGMGFLWFNAPPAQVFMGDTGSLALGGMLGTIAAITKHEIVLGIIGGLFVIETLSVMIQVFIYKRTGKRVFLMAPIHHHFEEKGWSESKIVIRFWIIAMIFALIGMSSLKLR